MIFRRAPAAASAMKRTTAVTAPAAPVRSTPAADPYASAVKRAASVVRPTRRTPARY